MQTKECLLQHQRNLEWLVDSVSVDHIFTRGIDIVNVDAILLL